MFIADEREKTFGIVAVLHEGGVTFSDIHVGEVYAVLQRLRGVEFVEDAGLYGADPVTGERFDRVQRLAVEPAALVFSYNHQVLVEAS